MKESPILFSGPMVRAILEGRKTMTRRVCKFNAAGRLKLPGSPKNWHRDDPDAVKACPYGQPGTKLWVRETWFKTDSGTESVFYKADQIGPLVGGKGWQRWKPSIFMPRWASRITLEVTGVRVERLQDITEVDAKNESASCVVWHIIDNLREENLTPSAIDPVHPDHRAAGISYRNGFANIWDSLYQKRGFGWGVNPWVWVIEFKRVTP